MYFYNSSNKNDSDITNKVVCAIVFCILSFFWLYWFQADILYITQHILSGRKTHYNFFFGAVIITGILFVLQYFINKLFRFGKYTYALSYFPSVLLLAILSDVHPEKSQFFNHYKWLIIIPLVSILWGCFIWFSKQISLFDHRIKKTKTPRQLWINVMTLNCMMLFVAIFGNTNATTHYQAHIETSLASDNLDEALRTGNRSQEADQNLTMLRAFALSQRGELGDKLFEYPVYGNGENLLPIGQKSDAPLLLSPRKIFRHLGAQPIAFKSSYRYLEALKKDSIATEAAKNYELTGLLIDRKLDDFVALLSRYDDITDNMPIHYREALILYTHLRSNPILEYHDPVMDEDWDNFIKLKDTSLSYNAMKGLMNEHYGSSYWYYYIFVK
jgi:hypothetical protein